MSDAWTFREVRGDNRRILRNAWLVGGGIAVTGSAALALGARRAMRRWERSALSAEEMAHSPSAKDVRVVRSDGAELAVFVHGDPKGVRTSEEPSLFVLAHGWTNDSRVWAPVARRLVDRGHAVVTYDHRGHGQSRGEVSSFELQTLADDLWAVLEEVDARDAVVAGHSMGGITAQALATTYSGRLRERVKAIVLVATACDKIARQRLADRFGPLLVAHPRLDRAMLTPGLGPLLVRRTVGKDACRAHLDTMCEMFAATSPQARSGFLKAMVAMDLSESLATIDVPVTVIAGERDTLLPLRHSRRIASLVEGARLVEIPDAGHMLPIEVPHLLSEILAEAAEARAPSTESLTGAI